jgi:hypothetical protein
LLKNCLLPIKLIVICVLLLSSPVACSMPIGTVDLNFQSIEKNGTVETANLYEAREPALRIIAQPAEVESLEGLITDDAYQKLLALDFSRYFALAAFSGVRETAGYHIMVNRVSRQGNLVSVYVQLVEPAKNQETPVGRISPYHLVIVQKDGIWGKGITFALIANHALCFSVSHNIP